MKNNPFRARDRQIMDLVVRYRLALNRIVGTSMMAGKSLNAVSKVTARMCQIGLLAKHPFVPPENYFTLGLGAIAQLGLSTRLCEPLGPQALPTEFAVMMFAHQGETKRRRLTQLELSTCAPWLPAEFSKAAYCLDDQGTLYLVRVDLGGSPHHVAKKTAEATLSRLDLPQFVELAASSRFSVAVLTTTKDKAKAIGRQLQSNGCLDAVHVHLAVIPRLSHLLLQQR